MAGWVSSRAVAQNWAQNRAQNHRPWPRFRFRPTTELWFESPLDKPHHQVRSLRKTPSRPPNVGSKHASGLPASNPARTRLGEASCSQPGVGKKSQEGILLQLSVPNLLVIKCLAPCPETRGAGDRPSLPQPSRQASPPSSSKARAINGAISGLSRIRRGSGPSPGTRGVVRELPELPQHPGWSTGQL